VIAVRRSADRVHCKHGKLAVWSTFGGDDRVDALSRPFGGLAALEELRLPPGGVCTPCLRSEAVAITYIYRGMLAQENRHGCSAVMHAGEFHLVSAAGGVPYKEANASHDD
jgi:redox-sensitive bicupin YhaK (pirin superfamily)